MLKKPINMLKVQSLIESMKNNHANGFEKDSIMEERINKLCAIEILHYFNQSGIPITKGSFCNIDKLIQALEIQQTYKKFFRFIVNFLAKFKYINQQGDEIIFLIDLRDEAEKCKSDLISLNSVPEYKKLFTLLKECISCYRLILSGEKSPLDILFPQGDVKFLQNEVGMLIETDAILTMKKAVLDLILGLSTSHNTLNILEIGGGSGGLTWSLAPIFDENIHYTFTDISRFFILRAASEAKLRNVTNMKFLTYDLRVDPVELGYEPRSYDLILAYNVLHVVPNMKYTIDNLYKLLKPNALLIIVESIYAVDWVIFIWGILSGWWIEDIYRQQINGPLLGIDKWKLLLKETLFTSVAYFTPEQIGAKGKDAILIILEK